MYAVSFVSIKFRELELMIAAMPGLMSLVMEGDPAESGLDISTWKWLHARHCKKGCTEHEVDPDCYFAVIHHFLLRGYDPALRPGREWEDLRTKKEAYVGAWRQE